MKIDENKEVLNKRKRSDKIRITESA